MSLFTERFSFDPLWKSNIASYPYVLGGFVLKIVYKDYENIDNKYKFYSLFYSNVNSNIDSLNNDENNISDFNINESDSLLPVWFTTYKYVDKIKYYLRFYVPIQFTTNQPYGFCLCYYDPNIESDNELDKLKPIILSNRNTSTGYNLPYNQGRFNQGWNSISFTLTNEETKNIFVPIYDFSIFNSYSIVQKSVVEANELFENIVKNNEIRTNKLDDTASREDVIKYLNTYKKSNITNDLQLINGMLDIMPKYDITQNEIIFRH